MNRLLNNINPDLNLYFDNAATSWPKPEAVYRSAEQQLRFFCGNPGRSGHTKTLEADRLIYRARETIASLFNVNNPGQIVFTLNATDALNIALKGLLKPGDHVIHTAMDHNSVLRPLTKLQSRGITTTLVPCSEQGYPDLDFLAKAFTDQTRLLIINHASNVTGTIAPLEAMVGLAHDNNVTVLVDAAQSAGSMPIDVQATGIDLLAFTGHKSLLGPTGTGGLYVRPGLELESLREGGTGSQSEDPTHPLSMPERLEAGTLNSFGLAGLLEGVTFIQEQGIYTIHNQEKQLRDYLYDRLATFPEIRLYGPPAGEECAPIISLTINNADCGEVGYVLESQYGILCRTGLHCAPLAHQAIGTFPTGTIRLSIGYYNTIKDIDYLCGAFEEIIALTK